MDHQPPPIPSAFPSAPVAPAPPPAPPRRTPWGWIFGLLFFGTGAIVLLFVIFIIASIGAAMKDAGATASKGRKVSENVLRDGGRDKIAHIDLEGIITSSANRAGASMVDDFASHLDAAVEDAQVKAIVIRINSPGGEVTASDRLHQMIQRADGIKPVIAYMDTIAASGGYYAACGTRHLMAHPTTFTGSIGVIMQSIKYGEMLDKVGLAFEVYKSGEMKDLLSGTRETRPDEITLVNELIGETYDRFLDIVAENRGRAADELRGSPFTDGRIFSGSQGLAGGFIDSNGFIDDAYTKAAELAGVTNPTIIRYQTNLGFFDIFGSFASAGDASRKVEIDVSDRLLPHIQSGVPLYLHLDAL
ncbi:MAG: signal peptide peptidase SppA [Luteolibacter sp.]